SLTKLVNLSLGQNNLTGTIPAWIGNISSLNVLSLLENNFQGSIPSELCRLSCLRFFKLSVNNLSGTIPLVIFNISSIYSFSITQNRLHGSLPPDVGLTLPNLQMFLGGQNSFTGPIPVSLSNASQLQFLDFSSNGLTGTLPQNLASLQGLVCSKLDCLVLKHHQMSECLQMWSSMKLTQLETHFLNLRRKTKEERASITELDGSNDACWSTIPEAIVQKGHLPKESYIAAWRLIKTDTAPCGLIKAATTSNCRLAFTLLLGQKNKWNKFSGCK
ncbi:putative receptor-like protein kinase, partial [Quercus suber]